MLKAKNLSKRVKTLEGEITILHDVSFELDKGKSLAIVGESGSGKTTLLGLLAGLDTPSDGEVYLASESIFKLTEEKRALSRKNNLGFVFQSFQLIDGLSALENVMMPLELKGDKNAKDKALAMLEKVGLSHRVSHFSNQLSGGEQQRVAVARAFVTEPKLLLADEPTGNLDTKTGQKVIELMFELNTSLHTTMVLVTHDSHLAERCDNAITISAGKVIENTTTAE
ncbi:MAG: ATP-binding cassette domain-containing protein [Kangiellaceae bacterium]|nr:ATP-binding cassette domain-containing protein [Kangiellaceae bacterium]